VMGRMVAGAITGDAGRDPIPAEFDAARFSYE